MENHRGALQRCFDFIKRPDVTDDKLSARGDLCLIPREARCVVVFVIRYDIIYSKCTVALSSPEKWRRRTLN